MAENIPNTIGELNIALSATGGAQAKQTVEDFAAAVETSGKKAQEAAAKQKESLGDLNKSVTEGAGVIKLFSSGIVDAVAKFGLLGSAIQTLIGFLREWFDIGTSIGNMLINNAKNIREEAIAMQELNRSIAETVQLYNSIATAAEKAYAGIQGVSLAKLNERIAQNETGTSGQMPLPQLQAEIQRRKDVEDETSEINPLAGSIVGANFAIREAAFGLNAQLKERMALDATLRAQRNSLMKRVVYQARPDMVTGQSTEAFNQATYQGVAGMQPNQEIIDLLRQIRDGQNNGKR